MPVEDILKIIPSSFAPPATVVPYRYPLVPCTKAAAGNPGSLPLVPSKLARVVICASPEIDKAENNKKTLAVSFNGEVNVIAEGLSFGPEEPSR